MTDAQLYLAIGIPSPLFALNFLGMLATAFWQAKRFDDMGKRFDDMGKRLDDMSRRIDDTRDMLRSEIARVEGVLRAEINRVEGVLSAKIDRLTDRVKTLEDDVRSPLVKQ